MKDIKESPGSKGLNKGAVGLFLTLVAAGLGFGAGHYGLGQSKEVTQSREDSEKEAVLKADNAKLREKLAALRKKIAELESAAKEGVTASLPISKPKKTGDPEKDALNEELYALQKELEELKKEGPKLDAAELRAKIDELASRFDQAVSVKDGKDALAAMREMGKLGEEGFTELMRMWKTMQENKWLELDGRERRRWGAGKEFFHWALKSELALNDAQLKDFMTTAIFSLRFLERNKEKLAVTFVSLLGKLPVPTALNEEKKNPGAGGERGGRGRGGRGRRGRRGPPGFFGPGRSSDPYRSALRELSRIKSAKAATMLISVYSNTSYPEDVRKTALRGLLNQPGQEARRVISEAVNDPSKDLAETATKLNELASAKVTGYYVRSVKKGGQAEKLGVKAGSVIMSYAGKPISSERDLFFLPRTQKEKTALVKVFQQDKVLDLTFETNKDLGVDGSYVKVEAQKEGE